MVNWLPTAITFVPLLFALVAMLMPKDNVLAVKIIALIGTGLALIGSVWLYLAFDFSNPGFQMIVDVPWIGSIGSNYHMAVDGVSLPMVLVTTLLTFLCIIASWHIKHRTKEYMALMLFLEIGMVGVFFALDFILFYVFWELVLIPMYFLIGIWGGPRREYAAIKFFLYTFIGSIFMLLGILVLYFYSGMGTFDMLALGKANVSAGVWKFCFWTMFLGFAVKVPIVPFHTWLPDAHVEAPTAGSVILAGVLLKMGTYAFVRIGLQVVYQGMKPFLWVIALLGAISIVYGAFCAMAQKDLKKMVAYSSVSHMGYVMLGIASMTAMGLNGAVFGMFSHGAITGMLFMLVGLIYDRTHTREIKKIGGLFVSMTVVGGLWVYTALASFGLPTLAGFIGEFLVLSGSFKAYTVFTTLAAATIVLTAGYLLWASRNICFGPSKSDERLSDATPRELGYLAPLVFIILVIGVYPKPLLEVIKPATKAILSSLGGM